MTRWQSDGMTLIGGPDAELSDAQVAEFVRRGLDGLDLDGRSVCLVVPDATRSCPLPQLMREIHAALTGRVGSMTALVALGTHAAMTDEQLAAHLGRVVPGPAPWSTTSGGTRTPSSRSAPSLPAA